MFFLLVRLLAQSLDAAYTESGFTIFPDAGPLGCRPCAAVRCIVGTGDDALQTHATTCQIRGASAPCARRNALLHPRMAPGGHRFAFFQSACGRWQIGELR